MNGVISAKIHGAIKFRQHVEYTIEVFVDGESTWSVDRRYSHFRKVRRELRSRHKVSSSFPSKSFVGKFSDALIEKRCAALQKYLNDVLRILGLHLPLCVAELLGWQTGSSATGMRKPRARPMSSESVLSDSEVHSQAGTTNSRPGSMCSSTSSKYSVAQSSAIFAEDHVSEGSMALKSSEAGSEIPLSLREHIPPSLPVRDAFRPSLSLEALAMLQQANSSW